MLPKRPGRYEYQVVPKPHARSEATGMHTPRIPPGDYPSGIRTSVITVQAPHSVTVPIRSL